MDVSEQRTVERGRFNYGRRDLSVVFSSLIELRRL